MTIDRITKASDPDAGGGCEPTGQNKSKIDSIGQT
jgi:hypothetical protein